MYSVFQMVVAAPILPENFMLVKVLQYVLINLYGFLFSLVVEPAHRHTGKLQQVTQG